MRELAGLTMTFTEFKTKWEGVIGVRYHSGGSMKLNACILLLAHMVYL
jgi:hypothetical protein